METPTNSAFDQVNDPGLLSTEDSSFDAATLAFYEQTYFTDSGPAPQQSQGYNFQDQVGFQPDPSGSIAALGSSPDNMQPSYSAPYSQIDGNNSDFPYQSHDDPGSLA